MKFFKKIFSVLFTVLCLFMLYGCSVQEDSSGRGLPDSIAEIVETTCTENAQLTETMPEETSVIQETEAPSYTDAPETEQVVTTVPEETEPEKTEQQIDENGVYTTKEDVALYIHTYNKLPQNFITKKEAEALGWQGGSLEPYAEGKCIGGSRFGNYEGLLPEKEGRKYTECDIDTFGASKRGAKRIVFSNDGLIYYTDDHYESFELLYGSED